MNSWNIISILVLITIFTPIFLILYNFNISSDNWVHIKSNLLRKYIFSTVYIILGVGFLSSIIGVGSAWFVTCHDFYGRKTLEWILILPLTIPTYIAAYAYYDALELLNPVFNWSRSHIGIKETMLLENSAIYLIVIILFSFVLYPYIYLSVRASLLISGNRLVESAATLGLPSKKVFSKLILPFIKPAIIAGLSLVIMETLNDYAAVEYFGISTLTIGIFRSWFGMYDMASALKLSSYLILFTFFILVMEKAYRGKERYNNITGSQNSFRKIPIENKRLLFVYIFCCTPFIFGVLIPVIRLISWLWYSNFNYADMNILKISINTILISLLSSLSIVCIAFTINFIKNYFNNRVLKKMSQLAILGYSIPGAIIAIGILKLNSYFNDISNTLIIGSIFGLVFAYTVRFLAVAWQPIQSSMEKQCKNINNASRVLKVSPSKSFFKINLPILKKPLLIVALIVFIDVAKELPLTLILRPFNFDTLATYTYDLINQAQFFQSSLPSLLIILISFPAIIYINKGTRSES